MFRLKLLNLLWHTLIHENRKTIPRIFSEKETKIEQLIFLKQNLNPFKKLVSLYLIKMKSRLKIFKFITLALCLLYLFSSFGITVYACTCTHSKQITILDSKAEHKCEKKQKKICRFQIQDYQHTQSIHISKKPCCTSETASLTTEHQPEQVRLNILSADFIQLILLALAAEIDQPIHPNTLAGTLDRHVTPQKIPIIYQHSCLRL